MGHLGYARWENFQTAINRAMTACEKSGAEVSDQFREVTKLIEHGKAGPLDASAPELGFLRIPASGIHSLLRVRVSTVFPRSTHRIQDTNSGRGFVLSIIAF